MASVGVRELKEHTSEIVRRVRDDGETIDITYRGEVVATIAPKRKHDPGGEHCILGATRQASRRAGLT